MPEDLRAVSACPLPARPAERRRDVAAPSCRGSQTRAARERAGALLHLEVDGRAGHADVAGSTERVGESRSGGASRASCRCRGFSGPVPGRDRHHSTEACNGHHGSTGPRDGALGAFARALLPSEGAPRGPRGTNLARTAALGRARGLDASARRPVGVAARCDWPAGCLFAPKGAADAGAIGSSEAISSELFDEPQREPV